MAEILSCSFDSWSPKIGDPTVMGWLTVALYLVSGALALRVAFGADRDSFSGRQTRGFWMLTGILLLALAVNKQLDLQSFLTAYARCMAQIQGWYENRRIVQILFIAGVGIFVLGFGIAMAVALGSSLRHNGLALLGLVLVLGFVAIRAAGFHHMDRLIGVEIGPARLNWVLEMAGPLLILIASRSAYHREYR